MQLNYSKTLFPVHAIVIAFEFTVLTSKLIMGVNNLLTKEYVTVEHNSYAWDTHIPNNALIYLRNLGYNIIAVSESHKHELLVIVTIQ